MEKKRVKYGDKLWSSKFLLAIYWVFIGASILLAVRIFYLKTLWNPDPRTVHFFQPKNEKNIIKPERGAIIDHNGKILAITTPLYNIYMDCAVQKETAKGEESWGSKADRLAEALPEVLKESGKDAAFYKKLFKEGRRKGSRYMSVAKKVDHLTYLKLKELPLYNEGKFKGGFIVEELDPRQYPYENLAKSAIGYIRDQEDINKARRRGIEGKFDYALHGTYGYEWLRVTDNKGHIVDTDSTAIPVIDGCDVRTTLDIDLQDIADKALRNQIESKEDIDGGCLVLMEVSTGAIKAMVNLMRDNNGKLYESYNLAIARAGEPGSIMKAATLMTLLEDGKVTLETRIPTNHGKMENVGDDHYIRDYEREHNTDHISVVEGFRISSNYVFRHLVKEHYGSTPTEYLSRLYRYGIGGRFDFELDGLAFGKIPDTSAKNWSPTDLISAAIGYSVQTTPLHMVTFYNAIAGKGKMMKPYIVESIERDGVEETRFEPQVLNGAICSKATADTLLRALKTVTSEGTGTRLKNAKCKVAGKTGTSWIVMDPKYTEGKGGRYQDSEGRRQYQATFVGFFPADEPRYTAIVTIYSKPIKGSVYGGTMPAMAFREMVDKTYSLDYRWGNRIEGRASVPDMSAEDCNSDIEQGGIVPSLKGYGLKDALYTIENSGYRCAHSGAGHVVSQTPAAGTRLGKGQMIRITLK
jgi:cell division protein FtsI (penicillin-binding protein 3)